MHFYGRGLTQVDLSARAAAGTVCFRLLPAVHTNASGATLPPTSRFIPFFWVPSSEGRDLFSPQDFPPLRSSDAWGWVPSLGAWSHAFFPSATDAESCPPQPFLLRISSLSRFFFALFFCAWRVPAPSAANLCLASLSCRSK